LRKSRIRTVIASTVVALTIGGAAGTPAPASAAVGPLPFCSGDHLDLWTDILLIAFRQQTGDAGAPTRLTRGAAMMYLAMNDTQVSLSGTGTPYVAKVPTPTGYYYDTTTNFDMAAGTALQAAFPGFPAFQYLEQLKKCQNAEPGTLEWSSAVGQTAATNIINARAGDGSANNAGYTPDATKAGQWRPTDTRAAATPNWGAVRPFGLTSASQFRPPLPGGFTDITKMLQSSQYAAQVNEVRTAGSATATSAQRSSDQTVAAFFWANDLDGTYKPPGQLIQLTQKISSARPGSDRLKLFALLSMAMADAGIAAWDAKFDTAIDLWRPDTAIAEPQDDGNAATSPLPSWEPLSKDRSGTHFSPPFPAYVSGHATFAGAWAGIMKRYYGTDAVTFTATTEDPNASGVTRTFTTFSAAADEDAMSRLWLGVHYRWDADYGMSTGDAVAGYVFANRLR
jgi:hypothetical protein